MIFNKNLLNQFIDFGEEQVKLVCLAIYHSLDLNYLKFPTETIIQMGIVKGLIAIVDNYELTVPLFINREYEVAEETIAEVRSYFFKSYCGIADRNASLIVVKDALNLFLQTHTAYTEKEVTHASKRYVDHLRANLDEQYLMKISNFIADENKGLLYWLEDSKQKVKYHGFNDVIQ